MKKITKLIITILIVAMIVTMFSGCTTIESKKYQNYSFNGYQGDFVMNENVTCDVDFINKEVVFNTQSFTSGVEFKDGEILVDDEVMYYYNGYYVVDVNSNGTVTLDEDNKMLLGHGIVNGSECYFSHDNKILDENDEVIGKWSIDSNYATVSVNGVIERYLMFTNKMYNGKQSKENQIEVNLYSNFYSNTIVPKNPVANTGFDVKTDYLYNGKTNQIELNYRAKDYEPESVKYKLVDDGGYIVNLTESGEVYFDQIEGELKESIIISIDVDGIVKEIAFVPVFFGMANGEEVDAVIGTEIDLKLIDNYIVEGIDFSDLNLAVEVIIGENLIDLTDGVIIFNCDGNVVVRVRVSFVLDGKIHFLEKTQKYIVTNEEVIDKVDTEQEV